MIKICEVEELKAAGIFASRWTLRDLFMDGKYPGVLVKEGKYIMIDAAKWLKLVKEGKAPAGRRKAEPEFVKTAILNDDLEILSEEPSAPENSLDMTDIFARLAELERRIEFLELNREFAPISPQSLDEDKFAEKISAALSAALSKVRT